MLTSMPSLYVLVPWLLLAAAVFIVLFFITAPYGRYSRRRSGPYIDGTAGWLIMEAPAAIIFVASFFAGNQTLTVTQFVLLGMWESHYIHRAFIYPFTMRVSSRPLPLFILGFGFVFNVANAYLNGNSIVVRQSQYAGAWLRDGRFIAGAVLFIVGYIVNRQSDLILYRIRRNTTSDYAVPRGGLFRWISCPNYLGELLMWVGWAVATWAPVAAAFALWTVANLAPRAYSHHRWYRDRFEDYPKERRALLPGVW